MLTENAERASEGALTGPSRAAAEPETSSDAGPHRFEKVAHIEWLGQTIASLCWIGSVLAYGLDSGGDWLQLFAASSWLVANIATAR